MKIDTKKLTKLIEAALKDVQNPCSVASGVVIGEIDGAQIQLNVSREEDEFWPAKKSNRCVS